MASGYKVYNPYGKTHRNHPVLKFLARFLLDVVIMGLLAFGGVKLAGASGFKTEGGIRITTPWNASFTIGSEPQVANGKNADVSGKTKRTDVKRKPATVKPSDRHDAAGNADSGNGNAAGAAGTEADIEKVVSDYKPGIGADGTYRNAAEEIARLAGATVKWNTDNVPCSGTISSETVAAFCPATPDVIYVNESHKDYDEIARSVLLVDDMKHELAHRAIYKLCKTADPAMSNGRNEAIANSFAVLYFNANRSSFDNNGTARTPLAYVPDDASDSLARQIHDNQCNAGDGSGSDAGSDPNAVSE